MMMTHPLIMLVFFFVISGLWAPLLLILIPPVRNWCRGGSGIRWGAIVVLALFAFLPAAYVHGAIADANLDYAITSNFYDDPENLARAQQQVVVDALMYGGIAGLMSGAVTWVLTPLR